MWAPTGCTRACEASDAVEHDHDVGTQFDESLGTLDRELGNLRVLVGRPIERARDDLAAHHVTTHVGHFFRTLVDEEHHEVHFGIVALDRVHELLQDCGLTRLRRRHDEPALALADRRDEVDDPTRHLVWVVGKLELELGVRKQRREVFEPRPLPRVVGCETVDVVDA